MIDERDVIELRGLVVSGTHGMLDEERQRAQPFEVDVDLVRDLSAAGETDDLSKTIDYGSVVTSVATVVSGPHCELLEHLAQRIIDAIFEAVIAAPGDASLEEVTVTVRKTRPPVAYPMTSAGVRLTRRAGRR